MNCRWIGEQGDWLNRWFKVITVCCLFARGNLARLLSRSATNECATLSIHNVTRVDFEGMWLALWFHFCADSCNGRRSPNGTVRHVSTQHCWGDRFHTAAHRTLDERNRRIIGEFMATAMKIFLGGNIFVHIQMICNYYWIYDLRFIVRSNLASRKAHVVKSSGPRLLIHFSRLSALARASNS